MRGVLIATATVAVLLALATTALAQAQNAVPQGGVNPGANTAPPAQQQQTTLPSVITAIRRAGMGPGGFNLLCDDPLDPRSFTNECSAAGIGQ
jgi:hypothetical protein